MNEPNPLSPANVIGALLARPSHEVFCHFYAGGVVRTISCGEAVKESQRWAHALRDSGLPKAAVVAIILKHSPHLYFAFLGAMMAGHVPSFMPHPSAKQPLAAYWAQHRAIFDKIEVAAVVTYSENVAALNSGCPGRLVFTSETLPTASGVPPDHRPLAGDIAFMQHSSGTTGLKKSVMLSYGAVERQIVRYARALPVRADDCIVSWLPLYHDMGLLACFILPAMTGTPFVSLDAFEWVARPGLLFDAIAQHGGTLVWLPNFAFHHLVRTYQNTPLPDLSSMRAFINCSEPCRIETFDLFSQTFAAAGVRRDQLRVCYAAAETVFAITQTPHGQPVRTAIADGRKIVSVGAPLAEVTLEVIDAQGVSQADGMVGEVTVAAPYLFSGYHRDPALSARKLKAGRYHTGDLGFLLAGELYLLGRTDDLVIVNGRNLFAHEIEHALNACEPRIKSGRCVALGLWNHQVGSHQLLVIAETTSEASETRDLIRSIKRIVSDSFAVTPHSVRLVPAGWLIKTTSGKIAREQNLARHLSDAALRAS